MQINSMFQFLCVVTWQSRNLKISQLKFQFLCVVTGRSVEIGETCFYVLVSLCCYFYRVRLNLSVNHVLVSLCCYIHFLERSRCFELLFQFLCVVTDIIQIVSPNALIVLVSLCCYETFEGFTIENVLSFSFFVLLLDRLYSI